MAEYDVAVVGGGMVGASFALALANAPLRVVLIERNTHDSQQQASFDERTTALGNASRRIFQGLGVWEPIAARASAIRTIHVSDAGRFGFARLAAREQGVEAFGYVAANRVIGAALWTALAGSARIAVRVPSIVEGVDIGRDRVELALRTNGADERVTARLVVAADGAESEVRRAAGIDAHIKDYDQVALAANVWSDRPHDATAYERFTAAGPIALLPLHDGSYTAVWAQSPERADAALRLEEHEFVRALQTHFGWRAGRFVRAGRRSAYRLRLTRAAATLGARSVLIGNAAQALHPVAGQGFNLGLRDAAVLAEVLVGAAQAEEPDVGAPDVLARFAAQRDADRRGVVGFTDGLVRLFGDPRAPVSLARDLGLLMFDLTPPAKRALARVSIGFGGRTPRLARGLPL